jgi:MFS family permease
VNGRDTRLDPSGPGLSYRQLLAHRELRTLLITSLISFAGDQLARVALTVLVYRRTNSALLSGLTYAVTFLPALVSAPLLAGLADRLPRRSVMIGADLIRIPLIAVIAVPGIPLPLAFAALVAATVCEAPFDAARAALLPDLAGAAYQRALTLDRGVQQAAQVVGFAGGGALIALMPPSQALLIDAATFAVSALLIWRGVARRSAQVPSASAPGTARRGVGRTAVADARRGMVAVLGDPAVRRPVLLIWIASAVAIVPEGLAAPYAASLGLGSAAVGLLLAANPVGNALAAPLAARTRPDQRGRRLVPLALVVSLALVGTVFNPPLPVVLVLLAVSGCGMSVSLLARAEFVAAVPDEVRGRAFTLAASGITVIQGLAVAAGSALGDVVAPAYVVAGAGIVGIYCLLIVGITHPAHPVRSRRALVVPPPRSQETVLPTGATTRSASVSLTMPAAANDRA